MQENHQPRGERVLTTRIFRAPERPPDDDWAGTTLEERIEAVWTLTLACLACQQDQASEPRVQRNVVRILRRAR